MAGAARAEAERLVATVLAMAGQSGRGGAPDDGDHDEDPISGTARRLGEGLSALGEAVAGLVGQLAGATREQPAAPGDSAAGDGSPTGGPSGAAPEPGPGTGSGPGSARGADGAGSARGAEGAGSARGPEGAGSAGGWGGSGWTGGSGAHAWAMGARAIGGRALVGWATGSAECCVCPVCRAIAALRNPSPDAAERLATGAGDFAAGFTSLLRGFSAMAGNPRPRKPAKPAPDPGAAWSAATRTQPPTPTGGETPGGPAEPDSDGSPWSAATHAADREALAADRVARAARQAAHEARRIKRETERLEQQADKADRAARRIEQETQEAEQDLHRVDDELHRRDRPAARRDVWAAATAGSGDPGVAPGSSVDHDVPDTGGGSEVGAGDDARTGDGA